MKARLFLVFVFVVSQAFLTGGVTAQGEEPPAAPQPGGPPLPTGVGSQDVNAAVALGQPGLSFRYVQTFGVTAEPYPADTQHVNRPFGLFVDGSNNLYVVENAGRLLKYNSSGTNLFSIGTAGLAYTDDYIFNFPTDAAVDGGGNIWVTDYSRVVEYNASGVFQQNLPSADPWNTGNDNTHFENIQGIAFDSGGRMYVSDGANHRIQVYSFVSGSPVYSTTIGVTGVTGTDNTHFNFPAHIARDSSNRLYVVDLANQRVQRCTFAAGWTCATFVGVTGVTGTDLTHLNIPFGIAIDGSDNVYIADGSNYRVLKCNTSGTCSLFAGVTGVSGADNIHFAFTIDVAVDSGGNVYVADIDNHRVQKFNGGGTFVSSIGVTLIPYVPDNVRYYAPWGITVSSDGSLYFGEDRGHRAIKLNAAGVQQWTFGVAGVYANDNAHLGTPGGGVEGSPAVDANGRVYVPDTANDRIQILDLGGNYLTTFGSSGQGNNQFSCPSGVFIRPTNGDVYVADRCNQRVQVFDSNRVYKATLGVTGVMSTTDGYFNSPWGVAVDASGNIFVADADNHRVQKCALSGSSGTCTTFAGQTGISGLTFDLLSHPPAVAVDSAGRVYVADEWNNRAQVFDSSGAYLTTISGAWGSNSGQMRSPSGIAVDSAGNVYVTDRDNHRIQKFSPGVPGWRQSNINGFGNRYNRSVTALEVFNGQLYGGAPNWEEGGTIWRSNNGTTWTQVSQLGFGSAYTNTNPAIIDLIAFNGQLYAGVGWSGAPGQMWRSPDGMTWSQVIGDGFGSGNNDAINAFTVFSNTLYAGTGNGTAGLELWRSSTGNSGDWTRVVTGGFNGDVNNNGITSFAQFDGYLYASVSNSVSGVEIWRTNDGVSWSQVNADGFGAAQNNAVGIAVFGNYLYVGTSNATTGGQLWRSNNGTTWTQIIGNGLGDPNNVGIETVFTYEGQLYVVTNNGTTGVEVWRSVDGVTWAQINVDGFGDSNNFASLWSNANAVFNNNLFIGTWNWDGNGGEIWQYVGYPVYLPLILK